jgi:pimeloyl-ACP methyl ester carboxylesterase
METRRGRDGGTPTVLLVHGEFSDTGAWTGTIRASGALAAGIVAVANPLLGLARDAAYVAANATAIDGPVVLVGHGYGGAVVSVAATEARNVVGLVYVAAYLPAPAQSCVDVLTGAGADGFFAALDPHLLRMDGTFVTELYLDRDAYPGLVAADLSTRAAAAAAATQRPVRAAALEETPGAVGWPDLPSWYLVAGGDRVIGADAQRRMAARARAETVDVDASHAVVLSRPDTVADLIAEAVNT